MSSRRRFHTKSDTEDLRRRPDRHPGAAPLSEHRVVKMQHTIGNQAVQRLLQRAPGDKNQEASRPHALATIVLSSVGRLPGDSRVAGHEGKMEILSMSFDEISKADKRPAETEEPYIGLTVSRYLDKSSQALMNASARGEHITSAQFEMLRFDADGKANVSHTFDFNDGLISSYQMQSAGDSEAKPIEVMTIEFPMKPKK